MKCVLFHLHPPTRARALFERGAIDVCNADAIEDDCSLEVYCGAKNPAFRFPQWVCKKEASRTTWRLPMLCHDIDSPD